MTKRRKASDAGEASVPPAPSSSERETLDASVASLSGLNLDQLRLQWRNHLGGIAPAQAADPQHAAVLRPVRARDHGRANPRQGGRVETEGHLDGWSGSARLSRRKPRPPRCISWSGKRNFAG